MAFASGFGGTELDIFRPAIWGSKINEFFRANLVAANFFLDMSGELAGGGDTVYIPNTLEISASQKSYATPVSPDRTTQTTVTLTVDTWYYAAVMIERREGAQIKQSYMLQEKFANALAYACAKQVDAAICALFAGFSNTTGSSTATLLDSDIRTAIKTLDANNVPSVDRAFFFHPNEIWGDLMALDRYVLNYAGGQGAVTGGAVAQLYGIPVYSTTQCPIDSALGRCGALAHKDAIAWATLGGVKTDTNYIPEYLATLITADVVYGVIENRDSAGFLIRASS